MILGLDFHNVIDKYPEIFGILSRILMASGNQVYIITGHRATPEFIQALEQFGVEYTDILSIVDSCVRIGAEVTYDEKGNPWLDDDLWNSAKAILCQKYNVDLHIDDSEIYGKYFVGKTKYLLLK